MDEIRLSDLYVLNIEKEFSENLDFNSARSWHLWRIDVREQLVY